MLGVIDAAMQRYRKSIQSSYAAERDFAHIRRNQEQTSQALLQLQEEMEQVTIKVTELRMQVSMLIGAQNERK